MNHKVKVKKNIDPMKHVVACKPNYSNIDMLLQIIGQDYESSECVGFRIVDIRREKEEGQDYVDEFNEWRNGANEKYKLMMKAATERSRQMTAEQLANINASQTVIEAASKSIKKKSPRQLVQSNNTNDSSTLPSRKLFISPSTDANHNSLLEETPPKKK